MSEVKLKLKPGNVLFNVEKGTYFVIHKIMYTCHLFGYMYRDNGIVNSGNLVVDVENRNDPWLCLGLEVNLVEPLTKDMISKKVNELADKHVAILAILHANSSNYPNALVLCRKQYGEMETIPLSQLNESNCPKLSRLVKVVLNPSGSNKVTKPIYEVGQVIKENKSGKLFCIYNFKKKHGSYEVISTDHRMFCNLPYKQVHDSGQFSLTPVKLPEEITKHLMYLSDSERHLCFSGTLISNEVKVETSANTICLTDQSRKTLSQVKEAFKNNGYTNLTKTQLHEIVTNYEACSTLVKAASLLSDE